nr:AsmA family protein [uncultured Pseudodesulfovibrio sp.]
MKKFIFIGIGVVTAAIIAVAVLVVLNLGDIIKTAVEKYGPPITKTEVKLGSADISILSGSGSLSDFLLGNPKGFSMPSAVECDTIRVSVVTDSLTTDRIIIEEIFVDGPIISYEKKGNTDNFKTIVNNIKKTVAGEQKQEKKTEAEPTETGAEKKIQINNFIVKNGRINLGGTMLNAFGDQSMGIDLPDIHLKDIGKEKDTTPAEAFALVLSEMTGDITGTISQVGKQLQEELGKAVEGVTKGAGSAGDAIKGLFGSDN